MGNGVAFEMPMDALSRRLVASAAENCWQEHHEFDWFTNPGLFFAIPSLR
jgi:hypothetical protein